MSTTSTTTSTTTAAYAAEDISWVALFVVILVLSLAAVIVGMRIYTRIFLVKQLGNDDYCIVVTLLVAIASGSAVLSTIPFGLGRHTSTIDSALIPDYLRSFWLSIVFYNLTLATIKLTFLFQYYRVLSIHKMKRVIWALGTVIMLWAVSQLLVVIFSCSPVDKFWNTDVEGHCMSNLPFWYINAAGNIVTDLAIFIMPLPVLNKLQLRKKQKYFLIGIFSLGFFTCAISLIRLAYLKQGPDFTFDNVATSCWSVGELCCGIICSCLPTLRPLMAKIKPAWMTSYATKRTRHRYGGESGKGGQYASNGYGHAAEAKAGLSGNRSRSTRDSILTSSTLNGNGKSYNKLRDQDGVSVMVEPMPPSPAFRIGRKGRHDDVEEDSVQILGRTHDDLRYGESDGVPMQEFQPRAKAQLAYQHQQQQQQTVQLQPAPQPHDKAMEVLGMNMSGTGVSTEVTGGRTSMSGPHPGPLARSKNGTWTGIEVKRSVVVTTSDADERYAR